MSAKVEPARLEGYVPEDHGRRQAEKHPVQWLRISVRGHGRILLLYSQFMGGIEDDAKQPTWFEMWYKGLVVVDGKPTLDCFRLVVKGSGLRLVCEQLAKGVLTCLDEGKQEGFTAETVVSSITLEAFVPEMGQGVDE